MSGSMVNGWRASLIACNGERTVDGDAEIDNNYELRPDTAETSQ